MCSPCGPMVCYKYEDCGPPKGSAAGGGRAEEGGSKKNAEKADIQLRRIKSRELRGGIMYYSCHCIKRNGLQHDCRRTGCGGEPACLTLPDPVCAPSQLARARGLCAPAPFEGHLPGLGGSSGAGPSGASGSGGGKKFIVCELKGIAPDVSGGGNKSGKCCKCPATNMSKQPAQINVGKFSGGACVNVAPSSVPNKSNCCNKCPPKGSGGAPSNAKSMFVFDEEMTAQILAHFEKKDVAPKPPSKPYPGGNRPLPVKKEEPCTRPGCLHWQPPPPCVWDMPCKADCFEAHPGVQPGRNPWRFGSGPCVYEKSGPIPLSMATQNRAVTSNPGSSKPGSAKPGSSLTVKCMMPKNCTGCCVPSGGGGATSGGPTDGMPVLVMKLQ